MRLRYFAFAGAMLAELLIGNSALAAFTGLQVQLHTTFTTGGVQRNVYRLYATFSEGADELLLWGGSDVHPAVFRTCSATLGTGTAFFNHASGTDTAPTQAAINQNGNARWDTFATIGVNIADQGVPSDQTSLTPGFPTFISSSVWSTEIGAAFVIPGVAQARADFAGDGDASLRILMAQLTCRTTETIGGVIGLFTWRNAAGQSFMIHDLRVPAVGTFGICCLSNGSCVNASPTDCATVHRGTFVGCAVCADCALPCDGDINGNGAVDIDDLLVVINAWGLRDEEGDINSSGEVDIDDLLIIVQGWGPCP
jgi:hypothetical protein